MGIESWCFVELQYLIELLKLFFLLLNDLCFTTALLLITVEQVARLRNQPITVTRAPSQMTALSKAMAACCGGNVPALRALLQTGGMNVNQICDTKNNSTFLLMAAYCGQVYIPAVTIICILIVLT